MLFSTFCFLVINIGHQCYECMMQDTELLSTPLSTPVHMHGGLICIAFRMSVTGPKFRLDQKY